MIFYIYTWLFLGKEPNEESNQGSSSFIQLENVARYQIEVKVLNDSWPLSSEQVKAMHYFKEHMFDEQDQIQTGYNSVLLSQI